MNIKIESNNTDCHSNIQTNQKMSDTLTDKTEFTFLEGDVINMLQSLTPQCIDCIVTSPPYNLGINYGIKVNDNRPREEYLKWIKQVFQECKRVLKDNGSLFLNVGYTNVNPWIAMDVAQELRSDYYLQNQITWVKNISINDDSFGHFKPINSKRFINPTNEMLFHFTKTGKIPVQRIAIGVPYVYKCNLKERSKKKNKTNIIKKDKRCRGNSWFIKYKTIQNKKEKGMHPAAFPVELASMCIKLHCGEEKKKMMILDPFVGSGSTLIAAKKNGHYGIGIDINEDYITFAKSRLNTI